MPGLRPLEPTGWFASLVSLIDGFKPRGLASADTGLAYHTCPGSVPTHGETEVPLGQKRAPVAAAFRRPAVLYRPLLSCSLPCDPPTVWIALNSRHWAESLRELISTHDQTLATASSLFFKGWREGLRKFESSEVVGTRFPFLVPVLPFGKFLTEPSQRNLFDIWGAGRHAWPQFSCAWGRLHPQMVGLGCAQGVPCSFSLGRWAHARRGPPGSTRRCHGCAAGRVPFPRTASRRN